jgi:HAD superfamily hydrolase (TIGR01549 family)
MAVKAVFFDVGETLVDETRYWAEHARRLGVSPHVVWAALGATIARGDHYRQVFELLGREPPAQEVVYDYDGDLYPDALPCLERLRAAGYFVGVAGNQTAQLEEWARRRRLPVDVVRSSASLGVEKPTPGFFERLVAEADMAAEEVAYVGDRVDNDVAPARAAGLVAVHLRRGPWAYIQDGAEQADLRIESLDELPESFARV